MHYLFPLFAVLLTSLYIVMCGGKGERTRKTAWVRRNPLTAALAVAGMYAATLFAQKETPPPPPPKPPAPIEAGVIYLYQDADTGRWFIMDGDIIELLEGEVWP